MHREQDHAGVFRGVSEVPGHKRAHRSSLPRAKASTSAAAAKSIAAWPRRVGAASGCKGYQAWRGESRGLERRVACGGVAHGACVFSHPQAHHAPEVYEGIAEGEASALLKDFFAGKRQGNDPGA